MEFFAGFAEHTVDVGETTIFARSKGDGPPLLLLHGFPQSHLCWWKIAPRLAEHFTVVVADLRGYGQSGLPHIGKDGGENLYSKRHSARDMVLLMDKLGFDSFGLIGHDRGARVAHRLCLDFPERVIRAAFIDIIPSLAMAEEISHDLAMAYFHQYLLAQQHPFPEMLFDGKEALLIAAMTAFSASGEDGQETYPPEVLEVYSAMLQDSERFFAFCEDYRAAAGIDLQHDRDDRAAGRQVQAPALVLWGNDGRLGQVMDVAASWQPYLELPAQNAGLACGHFVPEEAPNACFDALNTFFTQLD